MRARGKFLFAGEEKLYVRGVAYGSFRPGEDGAEFPARAVVAADFALMAENGINTVRVYTVPPHWLLDLAQENGLRVMVGIPWEQHVAFLDESARARSIEQRVRDGVRSCAGHPAVLCYVVGNEIPASIVRWHGRRRIERFVERLYRAAKAEDPDALVTYVNFPTTEYLKLPFLDFVSFNVFLESEEQLEVYLARVQHLAGDRPLVVTELGLDSGGHGEEAQALSVSWQVRTAFRVGCAGAVVFSWTDEWHRGGHDVEDWHFGVTDRARKPRPALAALRDAYGDVPFPRDLEWPSVSVVVCTYNGAATLADCLDGIAKLDYPAYETIVVDDGSTDDTRAIAKRYDVRLISTENQGLSAARNTALAAAQGELVAYTDDDASPDPHWLQYLAAGLARTPHAGIGGPNVSPAGQGIVGECVSTTAGGPIHVLLSDREAEHLPGCNMAFRRTALEEIGGFDPQFRVAGDDVDLCWRLRDAGWTIGFTPGAMVWHQPRQTFRAFFSQQRAYGKAEALLERKWPERYNLAGHVRWAGQIYGGSLRRIGRRPRIYYGTWGTGLFQSMDHGHAGVFAALPVLPEWYLVIAALIACSALGLLWTPLLLALPALALAVGALVLHAGSAAVRATYPDANGSRGARLRRVALGTVFGLVQPAARLTGRLRHGLTPWRLRGGSARVALPWPRVATVWSENWESASAWLGSLEAWFRLQSNDVRRGGEYDRWDLQIRGGTLGAARLRMAVEEHGAGRQLLRYRIWPHLSKACILLLAVLTLLGVAGALDGTWVVVGIAGVLAAATVFKMVREAAVATNAALQAVAWQDGGERDLHATLADQLRHAKAAVAHALAQERLDR